ncbi:hypothetical protein LI328DRAFT_130789 [Trichoderma asperelloides]|nr:hypothetical protein LI328DRAFT_130789 [Trichoderma asperelloides]
MKLPCGQCRQAFRRRRCGFQHVTEISVSRALLCCVCVEAVFPVSFFLLRLPAILIPFFIYLVGGPTPSHLTYKRTSSSSLRIGSILGVACSFFWEPFFWYT